MKKERWRLQIIITRDRTITRERPKPPASAGAVAELIAFAPRTRRAQLMAKATIGRVYRARQEAL